MGSGARQRMDYCWRMKERGQGGRAGASPAPTIHGWVGLPGRLVIGQVQEHRSQRMGKGIRLLADLLSFRSLSFPRGNTSIQVEMCFASYDSIAHPGPYTPVSESQVG